MEGDIMHNRFSLVVSAGIGALAMYYLDPSRGRYRRAVARDQMAHAGHRLQRGWGVTGRDLRHRASGAMARVHSAMQAEPVDDLILVERVRSALGHVTSHPASIEVTATNGVITLSGSISREEIPLIVDQVLGVPGIKGIDNRLERHEESGSLSGLGGRAGRRRGKKSGALRANWSPSTRFIGGLTGLAAAIYGFSRRNSAGTILSAAGLLLLGRAGTNLEFRRWIGAGAARNGIKVGKTIKINAPVEKVFQVWENFENFPSFMTHVRRVQPLQNHGRHTRWRWTVQGPRGWEFDFDSTVSAHQDNRLLAWHTEPGSMIQHAGRVRFLGERDGSTTVDVKMIYNPVAGAFGHAIAWLLGSDPKQQMDDDLMRLKTFIETGKTAHDAAANEKKFEKEGSPQLTANPGAGKEQIVTHH